MNEPAAGVLQAYLAAQVRALRTADIAFRREPDDLEAVHQLRVATRRLRSCLRTFRPLLERAWTTPLESELTWFGRSLRDLRESDVLSQRLIRHSADLPADLPVAAVRTLISDVLGAAVADAHKQVTTLMNAERYDALHGALGAAVAHPHTTTAAERPANEALPPLVGHEWRRLVKASSRLAAENQPLDQLYVQRELDELWHSARLAAKRARYAAEAVADVVGKDAKAFGKQIKRLTDTLGERQDSVQAAATARSLAMVGDVPSDVAFALGVLSAQERASASAASERFLAKWPKARRHSLRWFSA